MTNNESIRPAAIQDISNKSNKYLSIYLSISLSIHTIYAILNKNIVNKHTFKKICMSEVCEKLNNSFRLLEILFWMGAERVNIKQEGGSDDLT